ncbi:MAG: 1-acyl-sn-glycerol-3-phosphate acyltransferase [Spirochaetaceae bacterium]|jgi:1-acyl-sn-glycerol-3-phosphate acyltransferase|nr:1-acyl-sn-glycerol-3-phosphate acyltransferase [Spirochaetaceae bacterium]
MPYKRGRPLLDVSLPFRLASAMVFYPVWILAQTINILLYETGYENIGKLRGISRAILVSNHTTFLDPVKVSGAVLPGRTWQTLLEGTAATPFLGTFVRLLGGMPLPPGRTGLDRILASAETAFRYRRFIHFYPEGECYLYNQKINEFKPGAFYIAAELDVPVIPMVTVFSEGSFRPFSFWGRFLPKEKLIILDPVYPSRFIRRNEKGILSMDSVREFAQGVREIMQREIDARQGSSAFYRGKMERMKGIND